MIRNIRWRHTWLGYNLFFKHFDEMIWSLRQFHANSTLQKRYQREPMERIALPVALRILSKRANHIYLLHFTLLRGFRSARRFPARRLVHTPLGNPASLSKSPFLFSPVFAFRTFRLRSSFSDRTHVRVAPCARAQRLAHIAAVKFRRQFTKFSVPCCSRLV